MFAEVEFEDEGTGAPTDVGVKSVDSSYMKEGGMASEVVRIHKPGDEGFSCVAGAGDDTTSLYDARLMNGDSWLNNECHCLRCEAVRVFTQLSKLQEMSNQKTPLVVVLLDLDNFGYNQFRSLPLNDAKTGNFDVIGHMYLWCFFGSCFARYHGELPDAESVCRIPVREGEGMNKKLKRNDGATQTVWQRLVAEGRCHFTPCGAHRQGADGVILQVAHAITHFPVIVLSGDREMLHAVDANRRRVGRKSRREVSESDATEKLVIIDVLDHGKRFVPVWRELRRNIYQTVTE